MARIVLATFGSLGDLHPFLALALRLRSAGHHPVIATAEFYRERVEAEGLEFAAVRPDFVDIERDLNAGAEEVMLRMIRGEEFLFRQVLFPYVRKAYEDGLRAVAGADLVMTTNFAFGPRIAAEVRGLPLITAVLQPAAFLSAYDPPSGPYPLMNRLVHGVGPTGRGVLREVVKGVVGRWAEPVHALRRELGLAPVRDVMFDGQSAAADLTLGLYSPLLGALQPDFPARTRLTGFCVYDSKQGGEALSPDLRRFLAEGAPPVVLSLGSTAVIVGEAVYRQALAATRALGERAVILVGAEGLERWRDESGPDVFVSAYEPHGPLLGQAAAVVHHGGAGTTAQALRAGRPQLVVPFMADQPDNAARLVRLGVARALHHRRFTAKRAAAHLRALLREPAYAEAAAGAAAVMDEEDGPGAAVQAVEGVLDARRALSRRTG